MAERCERREVRDKGRQDGLRDEEWVTKGRETGLSRRGVREGFQYLIVGNVDGLLTLLLGE